MVETGIVGAADERSTMRSVLAACVVLAALVFAPAARAEFGFLGGWGEQGSGEGQFESPAGIAADVNGDVYVADSFNNRIEVFGPCHELVATWGASGSGDGQLDLSARRRDRPQRRPLRGRHRQRSDRGLRSGGKLRPRLGDVRVGSGQFRLPFGVAVDAEGYVYVADSDNNRIQKFDCRGLLALWGRFGSGNGQFDTPFGLAVAPSGDVYVADTSNNRIQQFTSSGAFVRKWGGFGTAAGSFKFPRGVAASPSGAIYVVDTNNSRIQQFDSAGGFVRTWGELGSGEGQFHYPAGVGVDPLGNVYVTEGYPNDRVQMFGDPPPTIADLREAVEGLDLPHGIAKSLEAKLKNVREDDPPASIAGRLAAFVAELEAQSGKHVPVAAAQQLIAEAGLVGGGPAAHPRSRSVQVLIEMGSCRAKGLRPFCRSREGGRAMAPLNHRPPCDSAE